MARICVKAPGIAWRASLQNAKLCSAAHCFCAAAAVETVQDVADVHINGAWTEEEPAGDFLVGQAGGHQACNLDLPAGQAC